MEQRSPAVLLRGADRPAVIEEVIVSPPGPGEVRVRLEASGICHTDLYARRDLRTFPLLLGHEGAGVVESVGAGVTHVTVGDHVVVSWKVACGRCRRCQDGRPEHCLDLQHTAGPRVHRAATGEPVTPMLRAGTFCRYAVVPAALPFEEAALIGCAVATGVGAALRTAAVPSGAGVAVWGLGGVGLSALQGALIAGASPVVAVDPDPAKRALALDLGASRVVDPTAEDPVAAVLEATGGLGADFTFEAVGIEATILQALAALAIGGRMVLLGAAPRDLRVPLDARLLLGRQQAVVGCIYGSSHPGVDFPTFARWGLEGRLKLSAFVSRRVSLSEVPEIIDGAPRPGEIRSVVVFA